MSIAVVKYLNRFGTRTVRLPFYTLARTSTNESGSSKPPEPCPPKPAEPCPAKPDQKPPSDQKPQSKKEASPPPFKVTCPEPPPCPTMPQCAATICPPITDTNNPCNYCPPPCIDPTYPDITKLKKMQCLFQQEDDLPIYLKKGNSDAFLYQFTLVITILSLVTAFISIFNMAKK